MDMVFFARLMYLPITLSGAIILTLCFESYKKQGKIFRTIHQAIIWLGNYSLESYLIHQKIIFVCVLLFNQCFKSDIAQILGNIVGVLITLLLLKPIRIASCVFVEIMERLSILKMVMGRYSKG